MSHQKELLNELQSQGIFQPAVLKAMKEVPRGSFVLPDLKKRAYDNTALPIECEQTISQPYIVALMSQALIQDPLPQKILEIGTGSGYQTAILAKIFKQVWTIERIKTLHLKAKKLLTQMGSDNIFYRCGDGSQGWPEAAPFDAIIVTAAAETIPAKLLEQLNPAHGLMVIPIGRQHQAQQLTLIKRTGENFEESVLEMVSFVPLIAK